jgi:hypothetical protein
MKTHQNPFDATDYFIAEPRGKFVCGDCNQKVKGPHHDISSPRVEVWEFYSDGWTAPCVCRICKLSMPIYLGTAHRD